MTKSSRRAPSLHLRRIAYRAHSPQWSWNPVSGEGARRWGGRFNRRGVPALYLSFSALTAMREALPLDRPRQPLTLCAYRVDVDPVFDATDESHLASLGIKSSDLSTPGWEAQMLAGEIPASQALADRLLGEGHVGMCVQSFAAGADRDDVNLVLWRWGDAYPARVEFIDDEGRLRRSPSRDQTVALVSCHAS